MAPAVHVTHCQATAAKPALNRLALSLGASPLPPPPRMLLVRKWYMQLATLTPRAHCAVCMTTTPCALPVPPPPLPLLMLQPLPSLTQALEDLGTLAHIGVPYTPSPPPAAFSALPAARAGWGEGCAL